MQSLIKYCKKNYKVIIFIFALLVINYFALRTLQMDFGTDTSHKYSLIITIIFAVAQILLYLLVIYMNNKKFKIENIFLCFAIILGLSYLLAIPIGRVPDEQTHFLRAYEISEGYLVSDKSSKGSGGRELSNDVIKIFESESQRLNYKSMYENIKIEKSTETNFQLFPNTALYAFICYIPQAMGIFIGKILGLPTLMLAYLGRLFNLATWISIMYFTIKKIPLKKLAIFAFAFMPMSLQEASSLSADALTNAMAFALIGFVFYMKYEKKGLMNKKEMILMILLAIIMSMCKIVYLPLCLTLFLIPKDRFKSNKDKYTKIILLAIFVVLINFIWLCISATFLNEIREGVNSGEQVKFVLTNPINYLQVLFYTVYNNFHLYIIHFVGASLCYFDVNLSLIYIYLYLLILIIILLFDSNKKIDKSDKFMMLFVIIACMLLMFTSLYVQWTYLKSNIIDGVQGRYFIPLLLPLAFLLNIKVKSNIIKEKYIHLLIIFINFYALMTLFFNHI
ncbi:MAG: DUF2142 domain-containing protein [Bacilli bacterium]